MNIENNNLHNILSTLISNQASLYSKVSGNLNDIFYVETFDSEPSVSGLYIDHNGESRYWTGIEWEYISNEISDIIDVNSTSGTVPTSKAVYDFVNSRTSGSVTDGVITEINGKIENVSGNVKTISESLPNYTLKSELTESLNNYALKSELTNSLANYTLKSELTENLANYALKSELPYDIFYVETFDSEPSVSGLYINHNGESRYWTGSEWEYISNEISDIIDTNSTSGTIPTSKAVYDFVTASLNEFTPSTDTNVREVYYLSGIEFEEAPAVSGIYINSKGESKFWNGTEYEDLSLAVSNEINESSTSGTVSTSKAVYDFVTSSLAQNELSNKEIYYITSFDNLEVSGAGLYIDQDGQSKYWTGTEWELTSVETSNIISSSSTSGTIPTSKAVYDYISERNFGLSKTWKTVSTTSGSYAVVIGNGLQQKVTLTGNITLTPPVLNSTYYSLILQITKTSNQTVSINSTTVLDSSKVGTFQIKWFYDGTNTYRYEPIQVYID